MDYQGAVSSTLLILCNLVYFSGGQNHVPPGVHPQHYQQPQHIPQQHVPVQHMPQQHMQQPGMQQPGMQQPGMQQPGMHQQQMHVQQPGMQQVPVQQMHVQQPGMQQVPVQQQQMHHQPGPGHHGHAPPQVLNVANIAQEKEHIQEHMAVPIDTSKMTEQELQFHYFKMHDADNNNKLDGCELIKSLIHWHGEESKDHKEVIHTDSDIESIIDSVLKTADKDNDGYISYTEFKILDS